MSAAASVPLPPETALPFKIRAYVPVGLSYFDRLLSLNRPSEIAVFGLILVSTLGEPGHPTWAEISDEEFDKTTNVSREQYLDAIDTLVKFGYIRSRKNQRGRWEYSVAQVFHSEAKAQRFHCRCPQCKNIIAIDQRFIAVPHIVLRKLAACVDPASFACFMVILRFTLNYTRERGVYATPHQLEINDFERHTNYEPRSIKAALKKLCDKNGYALAQRKDTPGKPSVFCPVLENLFKLDRREPREISRPESRKPSERAAKPKTEIVVFSPKTEPEGDANESELKPYGYCKDCDAYFDADPIPEDEVQQEREKSPPRAGPGRAGRRPKTEKWEGVRRSIWEMYVAN